MEIYRVWFENTDTNESYFRRVKAEGIIPAIKKAIEWDDTRWEVVKAEKENYIIRSHSSVGQSQDLINQRP